MYIYGYIHVCVHISSSWWILERKYRGLLVWKDHLAQAANCLVEALLCTQDSYERCISMRIDHTAPVWIQQTCFLYTNSECDLELIEWFTKHIFWKSYLRTFTSNIAYESPVYICTLLAFAMCIIFFSRIQPFSFFLFPTSLSILSYIKERWTFRGKKRWKRKGQERDKWR